MNSLYQGMTFNKIVDSRVNMEATLKEEGSLSAGFGPAGLRCRILQPLDYFGGYNAVGLRARPAAPSGPPVPALSALLILDRSLRSLIFAPPARAEFIPPIGGSRPLSAPGLSAAFLLWVVAPLGASDKAALSKAGMIKHAFPRSAKHNVFIMLPSLYRAKAALPPYASKGQPPHNPSAPEGLPKAVKRKSLFF